MISSQNVEALQIDPKVWIEKILQLEGTKDAKTIPLINQSMQTSPGKPRKMRETFPIMEIS